MVLSCLFFDNIRVDDPVGAISVHGVCGAWGTLAVGLFAGEVGLVYSGNAVQLATQAMGVAAAFLWSFPVSMGIFLTLKYTVGLRASAEEEIAGLDQTEHGIYAYPPAFVTCVAGTATGVANHVPSVDTTA